MSIRPALNLTLVGLQTATRQSIAVVCLVTATYWLETLRVKGAPGDQSTDWNLGIDSHSMQLWLISAEMLFALALALTVSRGLSETTSRMRRAAALTGWGQTERSLEKLFGLLVLAAAACAMTGFQPPGMNTILGSNSELRRAIEIGWSSLASIGLAFFGSSAKAAYRAFH